LGFLLAVVRDGHWVQVDLPVFSFPQVPHGSLVVRSDPRRPFRVNMTPIPYAYVGQCCQYTSRNKGVSHLFSVPSDGVDAVFCLERLRRGRSNP
jgi:hypothetical protein